MRILLLPVAGALLIGTTASSQEPDPNQAAEAVVREIIEALEGMRYEDVVALVHPEILPSFRERSLQDARLIEHVPSLEDVQATDPSTPLAVADWMAERNRQAWEAMGGMIGQEFAGVTTMAELEALSSEEMLARWLMARDPRQKALRELWARGQEIPAGMRPEDLDHLHRQVAPRHRRLGDDQE